MSNPKLRKRRTKAYEEQNGLCYYCRRPMLFFDIIPKGFISPRLCTLEHLRDRCDPNRGKKNHEGKREIYRVAACYECNQKQAIKTQKQANKRKST